MERGLISKRRAVLRKQQTIALNRARTRVHGIGGGHPATERGRWIVAEPAGGIDSALAANDQLHRNEPRV